MPLAKTATIEQEIKDIQQKPLSDGIANQEHTIHPEIYRYFNTNPVSAESEIKEISKWANVDSKNLVDTMRKIKNLESKLGQPNLGETRISKMANWVRMDRVVKDTNMSFRQEINSIKNKHNETINGLKVNFKDKVEKLNKEIERIETDYKNAYKSTRSRTYGEMTRIKDEYAKQLKQLKEMRSIYQKEK